MTIVLESNLNVWYW